MSEGMIKPEEGIRATEDVRTDVSNIFYKELRSLYKLLPTGQVTCNIPILGRRRKAEKGEV